MADIQTKEWAFSTAIKIITEAAKGGYSARPLSTELEELYRALIILQKDSKTEGGY